VVHYFTIAKHLVWYAGLGLGYSIYGPKLSCGPLTDSSIEELEWMANTPTPWKDFDLSSAVMLNV